MSLIGWWPLHETSGSTAYDLSGNNNHGAVNGATHSASGKAGLTSYSFGGSGDVVELPASIGLGNNPFTVSAWVKAPTNADTQTILRAKGEVDWWFQLKNSQLQWGAYDSGTETTSTTSHPDNEWFLATATVDANLNVKLYINSELKATGSTTGWASKSEKNEIGGDTTDNKAYLTGKIADLRFYNRTLTPGEIQHLYDQGSGDYANPPGANNGGIAYYPLNGDANDAWGTNNGTINGGISTIDAVRGTAYGFNGTSDGIDIPALGIASASSHTISLWVNLNDASSDQTAYFQGQRSTDNQIDLIYKGSTSEWRYSFYGNDLNYGITESTGTWTHMVFSYDGTTRNIYRNGTKVAEDNPSAPNISDSNYSIGYRRADSAKHTNGKVDDVRVYNRALNPWEIHELYRFGTKGIDMRKLTVNAK